MAERQQDLVRTVLAVLFLGLLIGFSLWILRPFLIASIWAVMIVVATWPLMTAAQKRLRGKRSWAVAVMTVTLFLLLILPFIAVVGTLVTYAGQMAEWVKSLGDFTPPPAPDWLISLPLVGEAIGRGWEQVTTQGVGELARKGAPYAAVLVKWFASRVGDLGVVFVESLIAVLVSAVLYVRGERVAEQALRFGRRLAGSNGENAVRLAARAIRGVALGVVVTALVQAVIGGIGLAVAGVPFAIVLTAVMFIFSIAQVGAVPVLIPAVIWLYWSGSAGWGTFLLIVTVVVGMLDNFLRPVLITRGADLPLLLVFSGVVGGLIAFGLIGIFVGPVVLAVAYTLLGAWINEEPQSHQVSR
ncbi:MAG: AI-2E family transporter YdiK [Nitrospirae bacterium]|nr:AI-2E family transporter YdiK [Nitrospirota bacterium]